MLSYENRVLAVGFAAAIAGLVAIGLLQAAELVTAETGTFLAGLWFLPVAIAAPQLYLAARGVEPRRLRRLLAGGVLAFSLTSALAQYVAVVLAIAAGLAVVVAFVAYEWSEGSREPAAAE